MHQSSPRHALSDVLSASQMVTTAQPMLGGGMGVIGSIGGAGGGVSIGGAGAGAGGGGGVAELKPRFYDEVSELAKKKKKKVDKNSRAPSSKLLTTLS